MAPGRGDRSGTGRLAGWLRIVAGGSALAAAILVGWWLGGLVEARLGGAPWGTLIGVLVGTAAGLWELWRIAFGDRDGGTG